MARRVKRCSGGDCLIVKKAVNTDQAVLHSSRRPFAEVLVDPDEWTNFLAQVKAGEWDNVLTDAGEAASASTLPRR
jgi:hypothetical protein